jgi:HEAT repeat protein
VNLLSIPLLVVLSGLGTPARNGRPPVTPAPEADAGAPADASEPARSDQEISETVHTYLAAIDTPIRASQWKALGPQAVAPLAAVVHDPDALPSRRAKAVGALAVIGGPEAQKVVLEIAQSEAEPFAVRASALRGAPLLVGKKELVKQLRPVMQKAKNPTVRAAAAEVLAQHAGASACNDVRAQATRETAKMRSRFARALQQCGPSPEP